MPSVDISIWTDEGQTTFSREVKQDIIKPPRKEDGTLDGEEEYAPPTREQILDAFHVAVADAARHLMTEGEFVRFMAGD